VRDIVAFARIRDRNLSHQGFATAAVAQDGQVPTTDRDLDGGFQVDAHLRAFANLDAASRTASQK
jgi:hypothetical protein